jgi:hypothetical protein
VIGPSGLAGLAVRQLAAWQAVAMNWPLMMAGEDPHLRCGDCEASVVPLADRLDCSYLVTPQITLDATVRHLRARHADMEPGGL